MTRQERINWLIHPDMRIATKRKYIYFHEISPRSRSGRHRHMAEELILVLEGKGYDVHDGERWNWEQGDLICIPGMTVRLLCAFPATYLNLGVGGIEQLEDAPEWVTP